MSERSRSRRSPVRYLAPLALAVTLGATYLIIHDRLDTGPGHTTRYVNSHASRHKTHPHGGRSASQTSPSYYVVRPGDSLLVIAHRTGVSLSALERLNPSVSSTSLQVGQRLRLRR